MHFWTHKQRLDEEATQKDILWVRAVETKKKESRLAQRVTKKLNPITNMCYECCLMSI